MRRGLGLLAIFGLLLAACGASAAGAPEVLDPSPGVTRAGMGSDDPAAGVASGFNGAGFRLWQQQTTDENLIFSPLSIGHALLMARAAADGATGAAIDELLALPERAHEGWNALGLGIGASADREEELTVTIADRVWPRTGLRPAQEWIDLLARLHGSTVETLDLAGDPEGSRDVINSWVADQTNDLIPELLPEGFIQPSTLLVLTDAVYYEAQWQTTFGKYGPVDGEFSLLDGSTVDVSYLHEKELFDRRGEGDGFRGAELPYVGGDFSMLLIVPDRGRFEQVRSGLSQALLDEIDQGWLEGSYELYMPKWEDSSNLDLLPWLAAVGVAPGSYPAISPDAFLGAAVHGADIAVDEWGTVAAAATGMGFFESAPGQPDFTLEVDRPFLYLIRHRSTGAVLFAGQVMNPTS